MHDFLQGHILIVYFNIVCCLLFLCFSIVNPEPHMRTTLSTVTDFSPKPESKKNALCIFTLKTYYLNTFIPDKTLA